MDTKIDKIEAEKLVVMVARITRSQKNLYLMNAAMTIFLALQLLSHGDTAIKLLIIMTAIFLLNFLASFLSSRLEKEKKRYIIKIMESELQEFIEKVKPFRDDENDEEN